uniref:R3H domain-containing protein n=1 Tax=Syphacia muris TaxID=451379 RepID=A0A0N5A7T6_9BILA
MGVIRVEDEHDQPLIKVEEITYADYVFDDSEEECDSDESEKVPPAPVTQHTARYRKKRRSNGGGRGQRFLDVEYMVAGIKNKERLGSRKIKRLENARMICAKMDPNDVCDDFSDLVPDTISAFAMLFIDQSNMRAWNEFIEKDEEEQELVLKSFDLFTKTDVTGNDDHCVGTSLDRSYKDKVPSSKKLDKDSRNHHPAYSASACFSRLDIRFKSVFSKQKLPLAFMNDFENTLRQFFISHNEGDAEWTSLPINSGWLRLLMHGISQYLALKSQSYCNDAGEKVVKVHNERPFFIPPHKNLVAFLTDKKKLFPCKFYDHAEYKQS